MMITRDNYEEFFLLYIDNELSVADREAVERFIAHHPDLQEEWKALLHCRLLPEEEFVYPDKELLYMTTAPEEYDDLPHFSPDLSIVFPDKSSLYKEEKDKRIIWLQWMRISAAAVTVGVVALLVFLAGHHPNLSTSQPVAKNNKNTSPVTPVATAALYSSGTRVAAGTKPGVQKSDSLVIRAAQMTVTSVSIDKPGQKEKKKSVPRQDVQEDISVGRPDNKDVVQQTEPRDPVLAKTADITVTRTAVTTHNVPGIDAIAALQTDIPRAESSFATQELQYENEKHDPENNILVSAESSAPGKSKLRGLFRKVTRTFGKTADRDDDGQREVLIGAFQIALK